MKRNRGISFALVLAVICVVSMPAWAESPKEEAAPKHGKGRMHHGLNQPLHAGMKARMQVHDARLDGLVAAMDAAEGEAKIDAIAAVVSELVAQRRTRREHLEERWKKQQESGKKKEEGAAP